MNKYFTTKNEKKQQYNVLKLSRSKPVTLSSSESLKKIKVRVKNDVNAPVYIRLR